MNAILALMDGLDKFFGMNQKPFYNTVELTPVELQEATGRAISQEDRIFRVMDHLYHRSWTAWELKDFCFPEMEITSLRRSLFNLKKQGKIFFTRFVPGPKGKPVGSYKAYNSLLF